MKKSDIAKIMREHEPVFNLLKKGEPFGRLGKVFKTSNNYYFLDVGTGKIFCIEEVVYAILKKWTEENEFKRIFEIPFSVDQIKKGLEIIEDCVIEHSILKAPILNSSNIVGPQVDNLEYSLKNEMTSLTLEVTEECNLRCKYCIYHPSHPEFRGFGVRKMTMDTAVKAIDLLFASSDQSTERVIGFYGGEPLTNWKIIKDSIEYAQNKAKSTEKEIQFAITTNATLINRKIAEYLILKTNMYFTLSIDGPKAVHDRNRIFINGKGSFDRTLNGFKHLVDVCNEFGIDPVLRMGINVVVENTDYKKLFDSIQKFLDETAWIPKHINVHANYVDDGAVEAPYVLPQSELERKLLKRDLESANPMLAWSEGQEESGKDYFLKMEQDNQLVRIHNRLQLDKPVEFYGLNGCCVPGGRRLYVTVTGEFLPCEKVGDIPKLGNIDSGLNIDEINKYYIKDFINEVQKFCKNCWAVNLCGLCYVHCFDENGLRLEQRHEACMGERYNLTHYLTKYYEILESRGKEALKYLDEIEII